MGKSWDSNPHLARQNISVLPTDNIQQIYENKWLNRDSNLDVVLEKPLS